MLVTCLLNETGRQGAVLWGFQAVRADGVESWGGVTGAEGRARESISTTSRPLAVDHRGNGRGPHGVAGTPVAPNGRPGLWRCGIVERLQFMRSRLSERRGARRVQQAMTSAAAPWCVHYRNTRQGGSSDAARAAYDLVREWTGIGREYVERYEAVSNTPRPEWRESLNQAIETSLSHGLDVGPALAEPT